MICSDETYKILTTSQVITAKKHKNISPADRIRKFQNNDVNNDNIELKLNHDCWSANDLEYIEHERVGHNVWCDYTKINSVINISPTKIQEFIANQIVDRFIKHQCVVAFISGPAGTGKSSIASVVIGLLNKTNRYESINYCNTFNPTNIADNISGLLNSLKLPSNPLIINIDEIDIILSNVHKGIPDNNTGGRRLISDKLSWNVFMDKYATRAHLILLLTSNKSLKEIALDCDESYLRSGRVHLTFEMPSMSDQIYIEPRTDYTAEDILQISTVNKKQT
jgi:hypothetical protein